MIFDEKETARKADLLQKYLPVIRRSLGMSQKALGKMLDISPSLISAIETGRTPISFVGYYALRYVFDAIIDSDRGWVYLDNPESYTYPAMDILTTLVDETAFSSIEEEAVKTAGQYYSEYVMNKSNRHKGHSEFDPKQYVKLKNALIRRLAKEASRSEN